MVNIGWQRDWVQLQVALPGHTPTREGDLRPVAVGSRRQQLDRQIFTSEVFLLSSATELLFFSLRFVFSSYFFTYFFLFFAGQPQSLVVFSQPQAHSHFKLKIRKKHSGAHAQQRQTCRRNGQRWRTGAKGCCCCSCLCSSCCREKRKKKFLLPPLAAVSLGSRRNKKEIKAKNWVGWKFVYPLHTVPSLPPSPDTPSLLSLSQFFLCLSSWPE